MKEEFIIMICGFLFLSDIDEFTIYMKCSIGKAMRKNVLMAFNYRQKILESEMVFVI